MSYITLTELSLLRQRPHSTKLWLSIYQPQTILACQYNNATGTVGDYQLPFDNVTSGSWTNIRSGMTMLVGSIAGSADMGRIRIRSATASVITVSENSHINWRDNLYFTVLDFYEIWPIFTRYELLNGLVTVYKDYDILYTNQNSNAFMGSFICMGPHYAGFVGDQVYYTATGTVNVGDISPLTYAWVFGGGTPGTSSAETPGNVAYNTPGHYTTRLAISTPSGTSDVGYRHVSIYDRPEDGTDNPILRWEMDSLSGSRDEGGYSVGIRIRESISTIIDGSLVILFADDVYGSTEQSIGGNAQNRSKTFFVGYIRDGSIRYDYQNSVIEFEVVSPTQIMKIREGSNVSTDSVIDPIASAQSDEDHPWNYIQEMDVQKALYYFMRWHSTTLLTNDFRYIGTDYAFQYFETDPSSLYDAINTFLQTSLVGLFCSDRQGSLYAEVEASAINNATGTLAARMDILKQDWMGEPEIEEIQFQPLSYLEMGGVAWSGASTGTSDAFIGGAPGNVAAYAGQAEEQQGLILTSQSMLNTLVGNVYAWRNAKYPSVTFQLTGDYRNLDITPQEIQRVTVNAVDTQRGITWFQKEFIIQSMEWEYNPEHQYLIPSIELHEVTQGYAAITIPIPQTPIPTVPSPQPPTFPPFPVFPPPVVGPIPPGFPPTPELPDCRFNDDAAPNGPYALNFSGEIRSDMGLVVLWSSPYPGGGFCHYVRNGDAQYPTTIAIYGCWEQSIDNGATWIPWDDDSVGLLSDNGRLISYTFGLGGGLLGMQEVELPANHGELHCGGISLILNDTGTYMAAAYALELKTQQGFIGPATIENVNWCEEVGTGGSITFGNPGVFSFNGPKPNGNADHYLSALFKLTTHGEGYTPGRLKITFEITSLVGTSVVGVSFHDMGSAPCNFTQTPVLSNVTSGADHGVGTFVEQGTTGMTYQTGYFGVNIRRFQVAAWSGSIRIAGIVWRQDTGEEFNIFTGNFVDALRRVRISGVDIYNICACP